MASKQKLTIPRRTSDWDIRDLAERFWGWLRGSRLRLAEDRDRPEQLFLDRARQLPRIMKVEETGSDRSATRRFTVYIAEGDREAERSIYSLEADIYQRNPDARLDVSIEKLGATDVEPQSGAVPR